MKYQRGGIIKGIILVVGVLLALKYIFHVDVDNILNYVREGFDRVIGYLQEKF